MLARCEIGRRTMRSAMPSLIATRRSVTWLPPSSDPGILSSPAPAARRRAGRAGRAARGPLRQTQPDQAGVIGGTLPVRPGQDVLQADPGGQAEPSGFADQRPAALVLAVQQDRGSDSA